MEGDNLNTANFIWPLKYIPEFLSQVAYRLQNLLVVESVRSKNCLK